MRVFVMSSGSSGNSTLIESEGTRILVDAGLGPRSSAARLRELGEDLFPRGADAIVVTHEHGDHAAHLEPMARALKCPVYLHEGIGATRVRRKFEVISYRRGDTFRVGELTVRTRKLPHDSPQMAISVASRVAEFAIVTDLGHVPDDLHEFLSPCDSILLESNYCPELLEVGPYPVRLRQRVRGGVGHLSNGQAASLIARLEGSRVHTVHLGHISRANNTVERALHTARTHAREIHIHAIPHGEPRALYVVPRVESLHSGVAKRAAAQLSLPL